MAQQLTNPSSIHGDAGSTLGLACWVGDPVLLWLWCRPAAGSSDSSPSLGTSMCSGCGPKKKKKLWLSVHLKNIKIPSKH